MSGIKISKYFRCILIFSLIGSIAIAASAEGWRNENQIDRFSEYDIHIWDSGHWQHEIRDGRLGWYWLVNGVYYPYQYPSYPSPYPYLPSPYLEQSQPPALDEPVMHSDHPRWFYCEDSKSYYPYIAFCNPGWKIITPVPSENADS
ncbi:hypothetical protein ICN48_06710 [Polynucleobacter sp. JS-Safj-400b-B2]|uniref:hypothetical protein n=1 Tax=Polynucleobacter sp. JS-Safj-400b-B2 TaxID=2576921 RepID=UPI001C0E2521|nr:hypothetical protein [Polynucleobacter sp. JS-Safj-400b-B2]MBU3625923.1 hypothetical protein [Polynucleobacter sp. JS-Safj-400b-B2]